MAATVNTGLTMLYWRIGRRINQDILKEGRAEYGEAIVSTLSRQLQVEYGRGFSAKNLRHMIHFAEVFADEAIVSTLWRQLSWSHFKEIIYQKDALQRDFYAEMCRVERWSVRTLRQKIDSMLYERTAISNKPEELMRHEIDAKNWETDLAFGSQAVSCRGRPLHRSTPRVNPVVISSQYRRMNFHPQPRLERIIQWPILLFVRLSICTAIATTVC